MNEILRQVVELEVADFVKPGHEPCYSDENLMAIIGRVVEYCAKIAESQQDYGPSSIPNTIAFFVRTEIADKIRGSVTTGKGT